MTGALCRNVPLSKFIADAFDGFRFTGLANGIRLYCGLCRALPEGPAKRIDCCWKVRLAALQNFPRGILG